MTDFTDIISPVETQPFEQYREHLDAASGFMRLGIEDPAVYADCTAATDSLLTREATTGRIMLLAATNERLHALNPDVLPPDHLVAVVEDCKAIPVHKRGTVALRKQVELSEEVSTAIFSGTRGVTKAIQGELQGDADLERISLLAGNGVPEFMIFSKYDTTGCTVMKEAPPDDVVTRDGVVITSNTERIFARINELADLQRSVFESQAASIGYYGGLSTEEVFELVGNPDFLPIAAFSQEKDEAAMFTLFSPDFTSFDSIPWLNPGFIKERLQAQPAADILIIPLIITSKLKGLSLFPLTVKLAIHETIFRTQPNTIGVLYESSGVSIKYTPKTIHRSLREVGCVPISGTVEASYYADTLESELV